MGRQHFSAVEETLMLRMLFQNSRKVCVPVVTFPPAGRCQFEDSEGCTVRLSQGIVRSPNGAFLSWSDVRWRPHFQKVFCFLYKLAANYSVTEIRRRKSKNAGGKRLERLFALYNIFTVRTFQKRITIIYCVSFGLLRDIWEDCMSMSGYQ